MRPLLVAMLLVPCDISLGVAEMLRFAIQGDIHNFNRVPEDYLKRMLSDAKSIGCDFVAFLGDNLNGTNPNPMRLSRDSDVPIVWQRGDHEFFSEWGRTSSIALTKRHRLVGGVPDPTAFMRGAMPRFEALTGQPTALAFILKGILFIVTHNGKNHVWHDWQLNWLRQILNDHRHRTTVLLSHRTIDEMGETAQALRRLLSEFDQVLLFCDAHIHSPHPFRLIGNTLQVGVEGDSRHLGRLTFEGNWYIIVELSKDAIRILRRQMATNELTVLHERKALTTLNISDSNIVHAAFLMGNGSVRFNPTIQLRKAKLRLWGVSIEQSLSLSYDGQLNWREGDDVKLAIVEADKDWHKLGISKVAQAVAVRNARESIIAEANLPVRFDSDPTKVGIAGTVSGGTQYTPLILVRAPSGLRIRLEVDATLDDGMIESRHWVEGISDGGVMALQGSIGHIYLGVQSIFGGKPTPSFWRWEGVDGKTEIDVPHPNGKPRMATRLVIRLKALNLRHGMEVQFIGFVFPEVGAFFMPVVGRVMTQQVKVRIGGRQLNFGELASGKFREIELGEVIGGERIELQCDGSKLALVELIGEADGIMCHALRRVKMEGEKPILGELTEQAMAIYEAHKDDLGFTCIWNFRKGSWDMVPLTR